MHQGGALLPAVSSSAWHLHFPRGSNRNISIISRSLITRSPYLHLLNTVTSPDNAKALFNPGKTATADDLLPENMLPPWSIIQI